MGTVLSVKGNLVEWVTRRLDSDTGSDLVARNVLQHICERERLAHRLDCDLSAAVTRSELGAIESSDRNSEKVRVDFGEFWNIGRDFSAMFIRECLVEVGDEFGLVEFPVVVLVAGHQIPFGVCERTRL